MFLKYYRYTDMEQQTDTGMNRHEEKHTRQYTLKYVTEIFFYEAQSMYSIDIKILI